MAQQFLIMGGNGMVGRALAQLWGPQAIALTHTDCDITQPASIEAMIRQHKPVAIFNGAAITDVDLCEKNPELAKRVNTDAVTTLAALCTKNKITLIHFSTDYVFDGSGDSPSVEDRPYSPISVYGASKAEGEKALLSSGADFILARVQWVFGEGRRNAVQDAAEKLKKNESVRAFSDQFGSTTYSHDIAQMVTQLYRSGHRGIFHTVNAGYASRVDVAQEIARQLHCESPDIVPVETASVQLPARRPLNSRLSIDKIQKLGIHPPTWQDAVERYLRGLSF